MFPWLKRHFIPHEGNDFKPHFLHSENARSIITIVLLAELVLFMLPTFNFVGIVRHSNLGSVLPVVLATLTNEERAQNNLPELILNPVLAQAAQRKAEDMATNSYFAHTSPDGKTPWYWLNAVGYSYEYAGENLAVNFSDSKDVTDAWMNSPDHKANIVKANYKEVGTGVAIGMYKGQEAIFVAQLYANPRAIKDSRFLAEIIPVAEAATLVEPKQIVQKSALVAVTPEPMAAPVVLGEMSAQKQPTFFEEIMASPRHMVNAVLFVVAGMVVLALLLIVLIRFNRRHPVIITNGLVVLAFIFGIYLVNAYISRQATFTTSYTSFNYQDW